MIQSTIISLPMTMRNGERTSPEASHDGRSVKLAGRTDALCRGTRTGASSTPRSAPAPGTERPPTSTMLRMAMMMRTIQSWKRSTMSASVSWNVFSFSLRLKTLLLTSTNWFDMRSERSALEYELTATLSAMTW